MITKRLKFYGKKDEYIPEEAVDVSWHDDDTATFFITDDSLVKVDNAKYDARTSTELTLKVGVTRRVEV